MLLYSTKALKFKGDQENFTLQCHEITDAPEWVGKTDEFKLAKADGCLTVTATKKSRLAAENGDLDK